MKSLIITLFLSSGLISGVFAQETDTAFIVNGVCEMCEKKIEGAALETEGVITADWNVDSKVLTLKYDRTETNTQTIALAINKAGYDTEFQAAKERDYLNLHDCCRYRDPEVQNAH